MSTRNLGRKFPSSKWLAAVALVVASLFAVSTMVFAQERSGGHVTPSGAKQPDTASAISPFRTYSCGTGYTFVRFDISNAGTLIGMRSGVGTGDFINEGITRSGYNICWNHPVFGFTQSWDVGESCFGACTFDGASGVGAPAVASGCVGSRFPCEITRAGAFGDTTILRRITGNSFVGPAPVGGTFDTENFNGVGCDTLGECGNCTNRTIHILTRVTNNVAGTLGDVRYSEIIDFDMFNESGERADEIMTRTSGSMTAVSGTAGANDSEDARKGALMQSLIINPLTDAFGFGDTPGSCSGAFGVATPTASGDFEARVRQSFGSLGAGQNTGNNFRLHVRGF